MELKQGMEISATDVNHSFCVGKVVKFLEHTIIIEKDTERFVISKMYLKKMGYSYPRYKKQKDFNQGI